MALVAKGAKACRKPPRSLAPPGGGCKNARACAETAGDDMGRGSSPRQGGEARSRAPQRAPYWRAVERALARAWIFCGARARHALAARGRRRAREGEQREAFSYHADGQIGETRGNNTFIKSLGDSLGVSVCRIVENRHYTLPQTSLFCAETKRLRESSQSDSRPSSRPLPCPPCWPSRACQWPSCQHLA